MKYLIFLALTLISISEANSQSLAGIWEGWLLNPSDKHDTTIMKLDIRLQNDSTYEIFSFSKQGDFKAVCKMTYKLLGKYSIYLEEFEVTKTNKPNRRGWLQNMKLNIDKDFKTMKGNWHFNIKEIKKSGKAYFIKKSESSEITF